MWCCSTCSPRHHPARLHCHLAESCRLPGRPTPLSTEWLSECSQRVLSATLTSDVNVVLLLVELAYHGLANANGNTKTEALHESTFEHSAYREIARDGRFASFASACSSGKTSLGLRLQQHSGKNTQKRPQHALDNTLNKTQVGHSCHSMASASPACHRPCS